MNAAGKEASPAIPSPAFYVWGAPSSENSAAENPMENHNYHPSITTGSNQATTNSSPYYPSANSSGSIQNTAQITQTTPERFEDLEVPATITELPPQVISQSPPMNAPSPIEDDANNFPSLGGNDNFPSLSTAAPPAHSSKGKGKKGRGKKGQQILSLGDFQRMSSIK